MKELDWANLPFGYMVQRYGLVVRLNNKSHKSIIL